MPPGGLTTYLVIAIGAVLGACARYLVGGLVAEQLGATFPYGTLAINVTGCVAIGFIMALITSRLTTDPLWRFFLVTGFLGSYTTFSAYAWEAAALIREGELASAALYVVGSVVGAMVGVFAGIAAAELL